MKILVPRLEPECTRHGESREEDDKIKTDLIVTKELKSTE